MPRAPASAFGALPDVSEWDLLMAAATMNDQGLLFEGRHDESIPIDQRDIKRDPDIVGEPGPPRIDEDLPNLQRDREREQRDLDREKRMREREEEFETDMFKLRRGR